MDVTRTDDRWEFRPSSASVRAKVAGAVWAAVLCLAMAGGPIFAFFSARDAEGWLVSFLYSAFLLGAAAFALTGIATCCRSRMLPLIIEASGRILYGEQEVCPAGAVRSVAVELDKDADEASYSVRMLLMEGSVVELPSPYFNREFEDREQARSFANEFAQALGVEIVDC